MRLAANCQPNINMVMLLMCIV